MYPKTKTNPWSHQEDAWYFAKDIEAFYANHAMGAGKSKFFVDYSTGINSYRSIIVCPKKVIPVWPKQFNIHAGVEYEVVCLGKGTAKKKAQMIEDKYNERHDKRIVFVLNYEMFWRPPIGPVYNKANRMISSGVLASRQWDVIAFDEIHRLMSPGGRASWGATRLRDKARRRVGLSGTAMPSGPINIYGQYRFLAPQIFGTSFNNFRKMYCIMGGYEERQIVAYKDLDDLNRKMYTIMHRVTREDALSGLPDIMHEDIICQLEPGAMKIYKELEKEFVAQVGTGEISVSNALVKLLRLSQLTGGWLKTNDGALNRVSSSKLDELCEKLDDLSPAEPIVIFYRFKPEVDAIKAALEHPKVAGRIPRSVAELSGTTDELELWQKGGKNTICVQIQAGGEGIDLTRACYGFYYSKGMLSHGKFDQTWARLNRPGQTRKTIFYHLICEKTVDVKVERGIKEKKNVVELVMEELIPFAPRKAA